MPGQIVVLSYAQRRRLSRVFSFGQTRFGKKGLIDLECWEQMCYYEIIPRF